MGNYVERIIAICLQIIDFGGKVILEEPIETYSLEKPIERSAKVFTAKKRSTRTRICHKIHSRMTELQKGLKKTRVASEVNVVFLLHSDTLHLCALPYTMKYFGLHAPIFATEPVCRRGLLTMYGQYLSLKVTF